MPENTNAHYPSLLLLTENPLPTTYYPLPYVFMTDPIARLDRLLLCPSNGFTGVSMLGDPVFLRNRSRPGLKRLRPLARRRSCASKCRDHAKFDSWMTIVMSGARERCAIAHISRYFI